MTLLIDNRTGFELPEKLRNLLERACNESLRYEEFENDCEISLSFVTNKEIVQKYRFPH